MYFEGISWLMRVFLAKIFRRSYCKKFFDKSKTTEQSLLISLPSISLLFHSSKARSTKVPAKMMQI